MEQDSTEFKKYEDELHNLYDDIKIEFKPKTVLSVTVVGCRDVSVDCISDKLDEPDPQVVVTCPTLKPPNKFQTATQSNSPTCLINETFQFVLPEDLKPGESFPVEINLYDDDMILDDHLGTKIVDVSQIKVGKNFEQSLSFGKHGEVDLRIRKYRRTCSDLRLSLTLHPEERLFRKKRIPFVMETLKKLIPEPQAPRSLKETPVVSVVASGGGYRAVVGMCGAMKAFEDAGIMDAFTYAIGLSGSSWYLSAGYALQGFSSNGLEKFHSHLKQQFQDDLLNDFINPVNIATYREHSATKRKFKQPLTFVDLFGFNLGRKLLGEKKHGVLLSDLQRYVSGGKVPFPIFAAINVKNKEDANKYYAYLDKSPFEISIPKFGIGIDPKRFGSVFIEGVLARECPEHPLHFVQGSCGSAFAQRLGRKNEKNPHLRKLMDELEVESLGRKSGGGGCVDEEDETDDSSEENETDDTKPTSSQDSRHDKDDEDGFLDNILKRIEMCSDRTAGISRVGRVFNPCKGMESLKTFNVNPHHDAGREDNRKKSHNNALARKVMESYLTERKRKISTKADVISVVDAALNNNVPLELALRPQRNSDVIIVLDFNGYKSDDNFSYAPLYIAATSAYVQGLKFPTVDYKWISQLPPKEFIWIQGADDEPEVLWFTLSNKKFKEQKDYKPKFLKSDGSGNFNDFPVFDGSFYTFKLDYTQLEFDRLQELMYFNVASHMEEVKSAISRAVEKQRKREIGKI